jgi:hypothetical protein
MFMARAGESGERAGAARFGARNCICPKFQQLKCGPARHLGFAGATATLTSMEAWLQHLLTQLALPEYGLSTVFVVAFVSATLLPMGSEPAVFGLVKLNPDLFWSAVLVATAGNTLGGALTWWMGLGAHEGRRQIPPLGHAHQGAGVAGEARPQGLPAGLAARSGRSAVRGGRLAQAAVLALRGLHGRRQAGALRDHDRQSALGVPGQAADDRMMLSFM